MSDLVGRERYERQLADVLKDGKLWPFAGVICRDCLRPLPVRDPSPGLSAVPLDKRCRCGSSVSEAEIGAAHGINAGVVFETVTSRSLSEGGEPV